MGKYFGKVCAKHPDLRGERDKDRNCSACRRERRRRQRKTDPRVRERERLWAQANPDRVRAKLERWRRANVEKERIRSLEKRHRNLAKARDQGRRWCAENPDKKRAKDALARARKRAASVLLTKEDRARILAIYAEAARLTRATGIPHHVDHDKPLARGGVHHPSNLIVIPASVNLAKGARYDSTLDFFLS